jgi:hypothetical protein
LKSISDRAIETLEKTSDIRGLHDLEQLRFNGRNVRHTARVPDQSKLIANRADVVQSQDVLRGDN